MPRSARKQDRINQAILVSVVASLPLIALGIAIPELGIALLVLFAMILCIGGIGWAMVNIFDR